MSLKQPWAALAVLGLKSIEVRRWATRHRGPLLIHAARIDDARPEAWAQVPPGVLPTCRLRGGVIGEVRLTACVLYHSEEQFLADQPRHLNHPSWFQPGLHGFVMESPRELPFLQAKGNVRLFGVDWDEEEPPLSPLQELEQLMARYRNPVPGGPS